MVVVATIKDVARLAGVGLGTASRVVSGRGAVAPATRERVQKAIAQLDFRPSHAARALLSGTSRMIGVYVPNLSAGGPYAPVLEVLEAALRTHGLHLVVAFGMGAGDARRQAVDGVDFLLNRGCDGVLVIGSAFTEADVHALGARSERLVFVNHQLEAAAAQCFMPDHAQGGALAAQALLAQGHRQFGVIAGPCGAPDNAARVVAFFAELARAGIGADSVWRGQGDFSAASGWDAAQSMRAAGAACTALWCANDDMALGAMACLQRHGVRVPDEVSVLGYDGAPAGAFSTPRLSTVEVPWTALALAALHSLIGRCYGPPRVTPATWETSLLLRDSLAAAVRNDRKAA